MVVVYIGGFPHWRCGTRVMEVINAPPIGMVTNIWNPSGSSRSVQTLKTDIACRYPLRVA